MATKAILIVDDEAIILFSLTQSLRMQFGPDYQYENAYNATAGLDKIGKLIAEGVDLVLVISDWLMPGMKGDDFLAIVNEKYPQIKLVMLSGHVDEADLERLQSQVKLEAFIRKPWKPKQLFEIVAAALA